MVSKLATKTAGIHGSNLSCVNSPGWWRLCNAVSICFFVYKNQSSLICHHILEYCCSAYPSHHWHNVSSNGYFRLDNAPCHRTQVISDWFHEHDSESSFPQRPSQSLDLSPVEHLWGLVGEEIKCMKCSTKICRNHMMQSREHGLESLRNVFHILWNPYHEDVKETFH